MENVQAQIEERINVMVGEILVVVRRAAIDAVNKAISGTETVDAPRAGQRRKRSSAPQSRRSPEELAGLRERLYGEIDRAPGQSMAVYAKALGASVRELSRPTQNLKKAGRVRAVGERDRTRYFPMGEA